MHLFSQRNPFQLIYFVRKTICLWRKHTKPIFFQRKTFLKKMPIQSIYFLKDIHLFFQGAPSIFKWNPCDCKGHSNPAHWCFKGNSFILIVFARVQNKWMPFENKLGGLKFLSKINAMDFLWKCMDWIGIWLENQFISLQSNGFLLNANGCHLKTNWVDWNFFQR